MSNAYVYQAAFLCEDCAQIIRTYLDKDEGDSNKYPQGPCEDGGGEADAPQHCDRCNVFLDNPLTTDGRTCVVDAVREYIANGHGNRDVLEDWIEAYDITLADLMFRGAERSCEVLP